MNRYTVCNRNMPDRVKFMRCYRCRNAAKTKARYWGEVAHGKYIGEIAGDLVVEIAADKLRSAM